jgi:hypothetical protein
MSSVITISQPPTIPGDKPSEPEMVFAPVDPDLSPDEFFDPEADDEAESDSSDADEVTSDSNNAVVIKESAIGPDSESGVGGASDGQQKKEADRLESLDKLQGCGMNKPEQVQKTATDAVKVSWKRGTTGAAVHRLRRSNAPTAVIVLKEEKVTHAVHVP